MSNSKSKLSTQKLIDRNSPTGSRTYHIPESLKEVTSVSQIIRKLTSDGWTKSQISSVTNIRYQHVRNVLLEDSKQK